MNQRDRDRLVVLKKAEKKLIQQKQPAQELGITGARGAVVAHLGSADRAVPAGNQTEVLDAVRREALSGAELTGVVDLWLGCAAWAFQVILGPSGLRSSHP